MPIEKVKHRGADFLMSLRQTQSVTRRDAGMRAVRTRPGRGAAFHSNPSRHSRRRSLTTTHSRDGDPFGAGMSEDNHRGADSSRSSRPRRGVVGRLHSCHGKHKEALSHGRGLSFSLGGLGLILRERDCSRVLRHLLPFGEREELALL